MLLSVQGRQVEVLDVPERREDLSIPVHDPMQLVDEGVYRPADCGPTPGMCSTVLSAIAARSRAAAYRSGSRNGNLGHVPEARGVGFAKRRG